MIKLLYEETDLTQSDVYIGIDTSKEYFLHKNGKLFFYDFCIPSLKLIIEFHGKCFHYDNVLNKIPRNIYNLDENAIREKDISKENLAREHGFDYIVVWENKDLDYERDISEAMARIRSKYLASRSAT